MLTNRDYQLVTPEAVVLELSTAGVGSRLVAFLIDAAIQFAAAFALILGVVVAGEAGIDGSVFAVVVVTAGLFLIAFAYPAVFETVWRGKTPGKAALGLRVVTTEGSPIRFRHAAVRAALSLIDFYLTSGAAAILCILGTRNDQRLGDLAAGTIVVRERSGASAPHAITFSVPQGYEDYVATLDVSAMTADHYVAVRTFLLRAGKLPPKVRGHLADAFAEPLAKRMHHTRPESVSPEVFLTCAVARYQQRSGQSPGAYGAPPGAPTPGSSVAAGAPAPPPAVPAPTPTESGFVPPS